MQIIKNSNRERLEDFLAGEVFRDFDGNDICDETGTTYSLFSSTLIHETAYCISFKAEEESLLRQWLRGLGGWQTCMILFPNNADIIQAGIVVESVRHYSDLLLPPLLRESSVSDDIWLINNLVTQDLWENEAAADSSIRQIFEKERKDR